MSRKIIMDSFALRQFSKQQPSIYINYNPLEFEKIINDYYTSNISSNPSILKSGYAPFCKHLFIKNFIPDLSSTTVTITDKNSHLIRTAYEARTEKELPVLRRYILKEDLDESHKQASLFLDVILYSKEQITLENKAMNNEDSNSSLDYDYGIISIKPQNCDWELPMDPITMMRNALGKDEGGSGVSLDKEKYMKSVEYWEKNVIIR